MKTIRIAMSSMAVAVLLAAPPGASAGPGHVSYSPPVWTFGGDAPTGSTKLVRSPQGLTAQFNTTGLTAGHAVTLWIIFFNNPDACASPGECNPDVDAGNPAVGFDFDYASGHVVNGIKATISGHLRVGELSTSGFGEVGPLPAMPLTNPLGAQVILALHSHGPAQTGQTLKAQMSSFSGGCDVFLGPGGIAESMADIPDETGECSTIQFGFHPPAP